MLEYDMAVSGSSGVSKARGIVGALLLGVVLVGCGGSESSEPDGGGPGPSESCTPTDSDLIAEALAYERALVIRGREDAGFGEVFGDESEALLDEADLQRHLLHL